MLDAAEVFLNLSRGGVYDFPSFLLEPMNMVGRVVARYALIERRNMAVDLLVTNLTLLQDLFSALEMLGYRIDVQMLECSAQEAERRNQCREADCISAYYAQEHHWPWLVEGLQAAHQMPAQHQ